MHTTMLGPTKLKYFFCYVLSLHLSHQVRGGPRLFRLPPEPFQALEPLHQPGHRQPLRGRNNRPSQGALHQAQVSPPSLGGNSASLSVQRGTLPSGDDDDGDGTGRGCGGVRLREEEE